MLNLSIYFKTVFYLLTAKQLPYSSSSDYVLFFILCLNHPLTSSLVKLSGTSTVEPESFPGVAFAYFLQVCTDIQMVDEKSQPQWVLASGEQQVLIVATNCGTSPVTDGPSDALASDFRFKFGCVYLHSLKTQ